MSITASQLKDYASGLIEDAASEVQLRSSVSRSYYAGFHALMPFVERLPESKSAPATANQVSHHEMVQRLREWRTAAVHPKLADMKVTAGTLVRVMERSRAMRVQADYRLQTEMVVSEAREQFERTRLVLRLVFQLESMLSPSSAEGAGSAA